jgi:uncharacterized protein YjbI with pentapeptide repeats
MTEKYTTNGGHAMRARLRSWWQYIRKHWIAAIIIALVIAVMFLIFSESLINGSGFNGYYTILTTRTISGSPPTITRTEIYQPGKTLWDWLQLLIIPAVLALGGFIINLTISRGEQEATKQRVKSEREAAEKLAKSEREIALDNQREKALQEYIDEMSELLLEKHLRESQPEDEVRTIARVRTLTTVPRLDETRKRSVLQFLHESKLIAKNKNIVTLSGADLSSADLSGAHLSGTHLSRADLREADLSGADLSGTILLQADLRKAILVGALLIEADLGGADLSEARLREADLSGADLSEAILVGALLVRAHLNKANLSKVYLIEADLREADLSGANLVGAFLLRARLTRAHLIGADLSQADLGEADLSRAEVTQQQLDKAKSLKGATMPDGTKHA